MSDKRSFNVWIDKFLEEKGEDKYKLYEIEQGGQIHLISNEIIIRLIKKLTEKEKKKIKEILVKIDFKNGDINHFFKHLAKGYIETNYKGAKA